MINDSANGNNGNNYNNGDIKKEVKNNSNNSNNCSNGRNGSNGDSVLHSSWESRNNVANNSDNSSTSNSSNNSSKSRNMVKNEVIANGNIVEMDVVGEAIDYSNNGNNKNKDNCNNDNNNIDSKNNEQLHALKQALANNITLNSDNYDTLISNLKVSDYYLETDQYDLALEYQVEALRISRIVNGAYDAETMRYELMVSDILEFID